MTKTGSDKSRLYDRIFVVYYMYTNNSQNQNNLDSSLEVLVAILEDYFFRHYQMLSTASKFCNALRSPYFNSVAVAKNVPFFWVSLPTYYNRSECYR